MKPSNTCVPSTASASPVSATAKPRPEHPTPAAPPAAERPQPGAIFASVRLASIRPPLAPLIEDHRHHAQGQHRELMFPVWNVTS
ncbi:MAG: hypothetical protein R3F43_30200 [bacterium]